MKLTLQWHACVVLKGCVHLRLNYLDGGPLGLCSPHSCYKFTVFLTQARKTETRNGPLSVAAAAVGCHFPHSPSPPGLPRARCLIGHLSDPFLCDPMAFEDVKSQPWACRPACIEGLCVVGTVPGARMQRCLGPRFCARRAQSGEGTGTVTRGYSDGLRGVRAFGEQPKWARASGKPHRGDDLVWKDV